MDESFATITGDRRSENLTRDLSWLGERGISVGVVFHGSDVRSPSSHIARESASYFRLLATQDVTRWEESTAIRRSLARESGLPLFVSTPDLLVDLPEATWLPLVTNLAVWRSIAPAFLGKKLRVLHVPSRRLPPIKGTSYIDPVLTQLANRGMVEYISPTNVAHERMPDLVRSVDVVIDQLLTGSYGVAAVEAMAAGRLVIGNVGRDVRFTVPRNIPIVDCPPSDLEELILAIVADPTYYAGIAAEGPGFAEELHSGARSASTLRRWLIPSSAVEDSR